VPKKPPIIVFDMLDNTAKCLIS